MRRRLPAAAIFVATLACSLDSRVLTVSDASPPPAGVLLLSDGQGFFDGSNAAGIRGYWYVSSDAIEPDFCLAAGFSAAQCSAVITPPHEGHAFAVPDPNRVCTSGVAAQVIVNPSTMALDYLNIWGANIGLDFNNPDRTNVNRGGSYDAHAHAITGFSFVIDTPPPSTLRVSFSTTANPFTASYWGGSASLFSPVQPGLNVVRWAEVGGPSYLTDPPVFDPTALLGMQFTVFSNANRPVPFDYCISSLTALTE